MNLLRRIRATVERMPVCRLGIGVLLAATLVFVPGCERSGETVSCSSDQERGTLLESVLLTTMTAEYIDQFFAEIGIELDTVAANGIAVYKLVYQTVGLDDEITTASGAVYVPLAEAEQGYPLLSIHHGTETLRTAVASNDPFLSLESIMMSSLGFLICTPDYLGLGESAGVHPYLYAERSASACVDFVRATRQFCCEKDLALNGQLFLGGYSEGGYVTLATLRAMEQDYAGEFQVTAAAPMAGPYDLLLTANDILARDTYDHPAYFGYLFIAYNTIYGWDRLDDVFQPAYAQRLPGLFDGTLSAHQINDSLTTVIADLFDSTFVAEFLGDGETAMKAALQENSLLDWTPTTPIRFYHGDADITVPYQNAVVAYESLRANGAVQVELVTIPNGTHLSAALPAIEMALAWFDSLKQSFQ
jgi:pimeloyl-ACP methyl ester carboxylesterase